MPAEYDGVMKQLIQHVVRIFYEPQQVAITDILLESIMLSDVEFCSRMKLLSREFNKLIVKLKEDHLIKYDIKVEVQEDNKQFLRTVYFFNYAEVRDIVKYKIYKMTSLLEERKKVVGENYYCPVCERDFSALDAQGAMEGFVFRCVICESELVEQGTRLGEAGVDLKRLMGSLEPVIRLLKEAEKYTIPTLDYFQVLEMKKEAEKPETQPADDAPEKTPVVIPSIAEIQDDEGDFSESSENNKKIRPNIVEENKVLVSVDGVMKLVTEITEDDKDAMTEDEYTRYYEVCTELNLET